MGIFYIGVAGFRGVRGRLSQYRSNADEELGERPCENATVYHSIRSICSYVLVWHHDTLRVVELLYLLHQLHHVLASAIPDVCLLSNS